MRSDINPRFDKLIIQLQTAVENGEGMLDKEATSYDDIFDALQTIAITLNLNIFQKDLLNSMLLKNAGSK